MVHRVDHLSRPNKPTFRLFHKIFRVFGLALYSQEWHKMAHRVGHLQSASEFHAHLKLEVSEDGLGKWKIRMGKFPFPIRDLLVLKVFVTKN